MCYFVTVLVFQENVFIHKCVVTNFGLSWIWKYRKHQPKAGGYRTPADHSTIIVLNCFCGLHLNKSQTEWGPERSCRTNTQGSRTVLEILNTSAHILVHTCVTERAWKVGYIYATGGEGTVVWGCTSDGVYVPCIYMHARWVTIADPDLCGICVMYFEHWPTLIQGLMTGLQLEIRWKCDLKLLWQHQTSLSVANDIFSATSVLPLWQQAGLHRGYPQTLSSTCAGDARPLQLENTVWKPGPLLPSFICPQNLPTDGWLKSLQQLILSSFLKYSYATIYG